MSERGVFAVARSIWDDGDFASEPFTEREAFMWLVGAAAWKVGKVRINNSPVVIERGEFCFAVRFLAGRWQWSKSRVDRFLNRLENRDTIRATHRDKLKVYSIKNYNTFQVVGLPHRDKHRDTERDLSGTSPGQVRDKEETGKQVNIETIGADAPRRTTKNELLTVLDAEHAQAIIEHRKKKRSPLTVHTAKLLAGKFAKCADPNAAADTMMVNGWQGFEPSWLEGRGSRQSGGGFRQNGAGGYVKFGSAEFDAWWNKYKREQSARQWEFAAAAKSGGEVKVDGRWPGRGGG